MRRWTVEVVRFLAVLAIVVQAVFLGAEAEVGLMHEPLLPEYIGMIDEALRDHPDSLRAERWREDWRAGRLLILQNTGHDHLLQGSFTVLKPDELALFGLPEKRAWQPMIALNAEDLRQYYENTLDRRYLLMTLWHEGRHYEQWQNEYAQEGAWGVNRRTCDWSWNHEFPVYLESCRRAQRWWPDDRNFFDSALCLQADDAATFAYYLAKVLGDYYKSCAKQFAKRAKRVTHDPYFAE